MIEVISVKPLGEDLFSPDAVEIIYFDFETKKVFKITSEVITIPKISKEKKLNSFIS